MSDILIGRQIRKARGEAGITQGELGDRIGVTWEMVSRYENGKSSPRKNLEVIAKILHKPIQYFFGVEERPVRDEIIKLTEMLERQGKGVLSGSFVPYLESTRGKNIRDTMKSAKQKYLAPEWITKKFDAVFALLLKRVKSNEIEVIKDDIAFFALNVKFRKNDLVLASDRGRYLITKGEYVGKATDLPVLISLERRFYRK